MTAMPASITPRNPDPMAAPTLRWGVMGTGWIADRFVSAVRAATLQRFVAVGSRDLDRARTLADRHRIGRAYGSYEDLAGDPEVDVVYVATGHLDHVDCARAAIAAGKHVLVEKPLAQNASLATDLADRAAAAGVFCAEALWTAFLPRFDVVRQILDDGLLGDVRTVLADCGEWFPPDHRVFDPARAGGPVLDLGTYPFALAAAVLPHARLVDAHAQAHASGVHGQLTATLADPDGRQTVLHTTILGDTPTTAAISGTAASLWLPGPFYRPGPVILRPAGGWQTAVFSEAAIGHDALHFQAAEVARCITQGRLETPARPIAASVATLRTMDAARAACGITFPGGVPSTTPRRQT